MFLENVLLSEEDLKNELLLLGLEESLSQKLIEAINSLQKNKKITKSEIFIELSQNVLPALIKNHTLKGLKNKEFKDPFLIHLLVYQFLFPDWETTPTPAWFPNVNIIKKTFLNTAINKLNFNNFDELHYWSVKEPAQFWKFVVESLNIKFFKPYTSIVDLSKGIKDPQWLKGAKINIVESCFQASQDFTAIIGQNEKGEKYEITYEALKHLSTKIAQHLKGYIKKGERVAIIMPMNVESVSIYLAIISIGAVVVSIAESFAADEINVRLNIADVKLIFTQDCMLREGKVHPLYSKVKLTDAPITIVFKTNDDPLNLREQDIEWNKFLETNIVDNNVDNNSNCLKSEIIPCNPDDFINILFSSGTTGTPKAIPWMHSTPIKCAFDAKCHHNLKPKDIFCWPTSLGWMMGPWLIFACLMNQATIALYEDVPNSESFGKFIQDAKVTQLGVVPSLVKSWRNSKCMEGFDWTNIQLFTSTGECSNIEDMLYLMYLAQYRPIIEYCGGTEIAGAYISSTLLKGSAPGAFNSKVLGLDFIIMDENGNLSDQGEVALIPPSMGLSTTLLNQEHHKIYYDNMPNMEKRGILRRHGDQLQKYKNGFYRMQGRVDDTMNLGGIKVSAAEIERVLNRLEVVFETAAVAKNDGEGKGGPSVLVIFAVLKPDMPIEIEDLKLRMQTAIKEHLNPLFKIHEVIIVPSLERTASNKMLRRNLRDKLFQEKSKK